MSLVLHQYRYDQRQFWREPASVFFTVVLPLIFLVLFVSIFGNGTIRLEDRRDPERVRPGDRRARDRVGRSRGRGRVGIAGAAIALKTFRWSPRR